MSTTTPPAVGGLTSQELLAGYRTMRVIREFEERLHREFATGEIPGFVHLYAGEEAIAAGVISHLNDDDYVASTHRGHGHALAKGCDVDGMMAEIYGRYDGICHGKGGSMHIADMSLGHLGANAIVGGGIPAVVGAGLAARHKRNNAVSIAFFGDGATGQGILYESMNMAALWGLPVVFACINNQYGMGTRIDQATANINLHERAIAFGLNGESVDGLDVEEVAEAARRVVDGARAGKPGFLAVSCYRFYGHARKDKSPYRDAGEEEAGRQRDPVAFTRARLIERGLVPEADLDTLDAEIGAEMDATIDFTIAQKEPPLASMFRDVFDPKEPEPEPVRTRLNRVLATE